MNYLTQVAGVLQLSQDTYKRRMTLGLPCRVENGSGTGIVAS